MTSKSRLSYRLELCELINQLDDDGCVNVLRSVYQEFGCSTLNTLLTKMMLHCTDTVTPTSFINMKNIISDIINTDSIHVKSSNEKPKQKEKQKNSALHRLPIDLMRKISLYLDEYEIVDLEQCCKLFYHITNDLSYINQSNTFRTFDLTPKRLYQMTQQQSNFYKYSKATTLFIQDFAREYAYEQEPLIESVESQFERAKAVGGYDKWLTSMFKSIKNLKIEADSTTLLPQLPIDILFDPDESNLETLTVFGDNDMAQDDTITNIENFYEKYIILKKQFANQGKKIRVLKCSKRSIYRDLSINRCTKLFFLESKHTCVCAHESHLKHLLQRNFQLCNGDNNSSLEILTFNGCWFASIDTTKIKPKYINCNGQMQIKTLRLIDLDANSNTDILENAKLIESLNLHNSVKNLTLKCTFGKNDDCKVWTKAISNLLTKKHYYNLDNVNILLKFGGVDPKKDMVNWIFEILQENRKVLKDQFKQLNIGLNIIDQDSVIHIIDRRYYVLKWDNTIDDKFLIDYQQQCNTIGKQFKPSTNDESNPYAEEFDLVVEQWLD